MSSGKLQLESVQVATFGRRLEGCADVLLGFEQSMVEIEDQEVVATSGRTHHPIVKFTGRNSDAVKGTVFAITVEELQSADQYRSCSLHACCSKPGVRVARLGVCGRPLRPA